METIHISVKPDSIETEWTERRDDGGCDVNFLKHDDPNLYVATFDKNGKQTYLTVYEGMSKKVITKIPIIE